MHSLMSSALPYACGLHAYTRTFLLGTRGTQSGVSETSAARRGYTPGPCGGSLIQPLPGVVALVREPRKHISVSHSAGLRASQLPCTANRLQNGSRRLEHYR